MKIGLEFETPLIKNSGVAATYDDNLKLWRSFNRIGYKLKRDPNTNSIIGVYKKTKNGNIELGTDYGVCCFEVAMPPEKNVKIARKKWDYFLKTKLLPVLKKNNLSILGYACQPKTKNLKNRISPKGHYDIWNQMLGRSKHFIQNNWPGFSAMQYNIDVPYNKIVTTTNSLLKLSCLFWAWSANSPIKDAKLQPWLSSRLYGYSILDNSKLVKRRITFPDSPYKNINDYILDAWKMPLFEIIRAGKAFYPPGHKISTFDFIKKKKALFLDLRGKKHEHEISVEDLNLGLYFYWPSIKIKIFFNNKYSVSEIYKAVIKGKDLKKYLTYSGKNSFIEVRPIEMTPQKEIFTWPVLCIGLINNINQLDILTKNWELKNLRNFIDVIQEKGLKSKWKGKDLSIWGKEIIKISKKGLNNYDKSLIKWLEPLEERLENKNSPANDAIKIYDNGGINHLIKNLLIK